MSRRAGRWLCFVILLTTEHSRSARSKTFPVLGFRAAEQWHCHAGAVTPGSCSVCHTWLCAHTASGGEGAVQFTALVCVCCGNWSCSSSAPGHRAQTFRGRDLLCSPEQETSPVPAVTQEPKFAQKHQQQLHRTPSRRLCMPCSCCSWTQPRPVGKSQLSQIKFGFCFLFSAT